MKQTSVKTHQAGNLPTPEQAFNVRKFGFEEILLFGLGPGVVAIGISIGSGEWLLGPLNFSQVGFFGVAWITTVSILLQVAYTIELARYTIATGEPPIIGFGRTPPGWFLWTPLALLSFFVAFILGGWAVSAGSSLFALIYGRPSLPEEQEIVRIMAIVLMSSAFIISTWGRKIGRTMEMVQGLFLPYIIIGLLMIGLVVVPLDYWAQALLAFVIPARPPAEVTPGQLGALAGFAALASGLNFMFVGLYRDKGYGMSAKLHALPGLFWGSGWNKRAANSPAEYSQAGTQPLYRQDVPNQDGIIHTFAETPENSAIWKRWFKLLKIDLWGIYFIGALVGMIVPGVIVSYLASTSTGDPPAAGNISTYMAVELGRRYGPLLSGWALLTGFVIMYSTQLGIIELLTRNLTDVLLDGLGPLSRRLRKMITRPAFPGSAASQGSGDESHVSGDDKTGDPPPQAASPDPRLIYYPAMAAIILVISIIIHLGQPVQLVQLSGNLSNFAALIFPSILIFLNLRLPRPARPGAVSILLLIANTLFFGFFFLNFLAVQLTGQPLLRF